MTAWCVVYEYDCGGCDESRHYRRADAIGEYRDAIADPEPDLAAVWVTRQADYEEWSQVVVGHDCRPDPRAPLRAPGSPASPRTPQLLAPPRSPNQEERP